ncbi:MAG TPA: hypothetical protein VMJ10_11305 [Kofleriaceae bacterium]|nr:hypothetical protein [Kofleriaceae bacterium]
MRTTLTIACLAAGCAGSLPIAGGPESRSWSEAQHDAQVLDRAASEHEREAESYENGPQTFDCGDLVLNDQYTTGGIGRVTWMPCFDVSRDASVRELELAKHLRARARAERESSMQLVRDADAACAGIPAGERERSVFARREGVASVTPHYQAGELRGVWVVFDSSMTAGRVQHDLDCQHARWVMHGMPEDSGDLATVQGARFHVMNHNGHVEVLVTTPTRSAAEVALSRANGLNAG